MSSLQVNKHMKKPKDKTSLRFTYYCVQHSVWKELIGAASAKTAHRQYVRFKTLYRKMCKLEETISFSAVFGEPTDVADLQQLRLQLSLVKEVYVMLVAKVHSERLKELERELT